jgi:hypothetical protein
MSSRDIWVKAGSPAARDVLSSLLAARLLNRANGDPLYVAAPYLTDFPLLENRLGEFETLFRDDDELGDRSEILFSDVLIYLGRTAPVLVMGVPGDQAEPFLRKVMAARTPSLRARYLADPYHAKGMACDRFFIEGSMNFTFSGLYRRDEKITVHSSGSSEGRRRIDEALLELRRLWDSRQDHELRNSS